jgi:hypothetical protein
MSRSSKEGTMTRTIPILATLAVLALAPAAQAQSPSSEGYGAVAAAEATAPAATPAAAQPAGSALPFTGTDAVAVALGGAMLLGLGGALRRATRRGAS